MTVLPFKTLRFRDLLRVTALVDAHCSWCNWSQPADLVTAMCQSGPNLPLKEAITQHHCPVHGADGIGGEITAGAPPLPFYAIRLGDLVEQAYVLTIRCRACRHQVPLDLTQLLNRRRVDPDTPVAAIARRLRCRRCGQVGWADIQIRTGRTS